MSDITIVMLFEVNAPRFDCFIAGIRFLKVCQY